MKFKLLRSFCFFICLIFGVSFVAAAELIIDTPKGKIRGISRDGINIFLGVPAGMPPYEVDTRLKPIQPVKPWHGVIDCAKQASLPLQPGAISRGEDNFPRVTVEGGGDCMRMNIWAPANQKNCPVLVYIPGGTFVKCDPGRVDGTAFARDGIVTVSAPYRVNVDGFMKISDVPENLALRDLIFDLQWVKDNIAAFGGDPNNVTIMGQSSGGTEVAALLASPLAKGLFKRAIIMSGANMALWRTPEKAHLVAEEIAKFYGVPNTREGIMMLAPEKLLAYQPLDTAKRNNMEWLQDDNGDGAIFKGFAGGETIPKRPFDSLAEGIGKDVDLLIGCTADEWTFGSVPNGRIDRLGKDDVKFLLESIGAPESIAEAYRANGRGKTAGEVYTALRSDIVFRVPTNMLLEARGKGGGNTWAYSFEEKSPAFGGRLGAVHGYDVPIVFNMMDTKNKRYRQYLGENPPRQFADKMHGAWVSFIRNGDPGWNKYDADKRNIMVMDSNTWEEKNDPWKNERELIKLN